VWLADIFKTILSFAGLRSFRRHNRADFSQQRFTISRFCRVNELFPETRLFFKGTTTSGQIPVSLA
jgi:hypothetical protein